MNVRRSFVNGSTPTVLLVHGAFTDGSIWSGVIAELLGAQIDVRAVANPLRGVGTDAAYLVGILSAIDGPVLLVGHAYGGVVVTEAGAGADNVVGLVYVAAFAPAEGESVLDLTARYPDTQLGPALRPATFRTATDDPAVELSLAMERYRAVFAADLPERLTSVAAVGQRPIAAVAYQQRCTAAAWRTLPSWFVVATADQHIHPEAQRFMARRIGAGTIELDASHAVALSRPVDVAGHIRTAALTPHAPRPRTTPVTVQIPPGGTS
jgi:pimeloyl-ACP methyl ester carboxylesterase